MKGLRLACVGPVALAAVACGGTDGDNGSEVPSSGPVGAAQCTEYEPDCDDTVVIDGDEEPVIDEGAATTDSDVEASSGMLVDDGLSVAEALDTDITGVIAVSGFHRGR
jgi:hypothetical protein